MSDLSKPMLMPRKPRKNTGKGEVWFYVSPQGLDVFVAEIKGHAASSHFMISYSQLMRAVQIIRKHAALEVRLRTGMQMKGTK